MEPFKHILVATDFEEPADKALNAAVEVAKRFDAQLTIAHVYTVPTSYYAEGLSWPTADLEQAARRALDAALTNAKAMYPKTDAVLSTGAPAEQILQTAKEKSVDLIVMGTHGRRGLSRVLLGSVAEKIVRMSPVPVLTVSGRAERDDNESK
jgi:nucleotide-binding universal stress UspA family protein